MKDHFKMMTQLLKVSQLKNLDQTLMTQTLKVQNLTVQTLSSQIQGEPQRMKKGNKKIRRTWIKGEDQILIEAIYLQLGNGQSLTHLI